MTKLIVYTDGGSRNNPGHAGLGVHITDSTGNTVEQRYKALGIKTNNQAEYLGAYYGIKRAIELGATEIELRADSKLLVEQLSGNYKIKNEELKRIAWDIRQVLAPWSGSIRYQHIYREHNKEADRLSNVAMDESERTIPSE